jgi:site-specific recombinase XerD
MEALSKLLGHASIRQTELYGKVTNLRVDDEIDKVWG